MNLNIKENSGEVQPLFQNIWTLCFLSITKKTVKFISKYSVLGLLVVYRSDRKRIYKFCFNWCFTQRPNFLGFRVLNMGENGFASYCTVFFPPSLHRVINMLTVTQPAHHWPLSDSSTIDLWMCSTSCSPCSPLPTGTNPTRNQYDHEPLHSRLSSDKQAWADGSPSHLCVGGRWTCRSRVEVEGGQCGADIHTLFFCGGPPSVF